MIRIYYGEGHGKSSAALGLAVRGAMEGRTSIIIQFLKSSSELNKEFLKRLEPELKVFRFEKFESSFEELRETQKQEETNNIRNGLNFARKVLSTGECDLLVLDELLGLVDEGVVTMQDVVSLLDANFLDINVVLTGRVLPEELAERADEICQIENEK